MVLPYHPLRVLFTVKRSDRVVYCSTMATRHLTDTEIANLNAGDTIIVVGHNSGRSFRLEHRPELQDGQWVFFRYVVDDIVTGRDPVVFKV